MDSEGPAISCHALPGANWPVLVSVPHAGRHCPDWVREQARVPQSQLDRLSDGWCDLIAAPLLARGATVIKANLLRAVADCNRNETDMDAIDVETPLRDRFGPPGRKARAGLGVIPARLPGVGALWARPLSAAEYEARLDVLHRPYHRILAAQTERLVQKHQMVLLIDLHSMPPLPPNRSDPHPAKIVVGDRFGRSAMPAVARYLVSGPLPEGVRAAINAPYAGGHIVEAHGRPGQAVHAVQIEFDRSLYLGSDGRPCAERTMVLGEWLAERADQCLDWLMRELPLAAE